MKTTLVSFKTALLTAATLCVSAGFARASFDWENLEGDIPGVAEITDSNVVNPWGIAVAPSGTIFVADNRAGVATAYFQDGTPAPNFNNPLVITIPSSATNSDGANPTGTAWNTTSVFKVSNGTNSLPAKLIFVSEDGMISRCNPNLHTKGQFLRRLVSDGRLNAPWGLEIVNGQLWVGNFGDGKINVYNPSNGNFQGTPRDTFGIPLAFDGLWGLVLTNGGLYFTAGI